jgi:hypothetical protein
VKRGMLDSNADGQATSCPRISFAKAGACVSVDVYNMYSCGGTEGNLNHEIYSLFYGNMNYLIYDYVYAYDACLNDNHLKPGTKDFDECQSDFS